MFADNFFQRIAKGVQKILICRDDRAIHIELNHGLRLADRCNLRGVIGVQYLLGCDIGREFHNFVWFAGLVENRIVGCLNPDFRAVFCKAFILG